MEEKLDGERIQLHKRGEEFRYYSRKDKDYTVSRFVLSMYHTDCSIVSLWQKPRGRLFDALCPFADPF